MSGRAVVAPANRMQPAIDAMTAFTTRLAALDPRRNTDAFVRRVEALEAALHELSKVDPATSRGFDLK